MASVTTPQRSTGSVMQTSLHSPASNSSSSSSSSTGIYYDFTIELDKTLSSTLWIEFMEWSDSMDVIALIMHQSNNDTQHLWLQRCVGKWQNLLNIDLSQEFDDPNTKVVSLTWRYDGNGVCLGLTNGKIIQFLIENNNTNNKIIKSEIHNYSINNIKWIMDKNDNNNNNNDGDNDNNDVKNDKNNEDINDINNIMQNTDALLSCTQLHPDDYPPQNNYDSNQNLLDSLIFNDETNKFLSKIPSLPKPPRIDFRYKIDSKQNTLKYIMKKQSVPPIPRKSQPISLPLLITSDTNEIKLHSFGNICIGTFNINQIKPSKQILKQIDDENENENKLNLENANFHIKHINLCNNLQCINSIISSEKNNNLFLRFIHCPILHLRRNEILIITNHCFNIYNLLNMLNKLDRHLLSRWSMGVRCIANKINGLQENIESYNLSSTWQHEFKHNLLIGSPSTAFLQYVEQNLNVTALQRGYKQFDQFINEMFDIIQKNLVHIISELIFRCCELKGFSLWMERFGCLGLKEKKLNLFIDKLKCLYIKLDQLQILITDAKLNLIAFKDYLIFLSSIHNNEDSSIKKNAFDKLNCKRIFAAIDYDLKPNRISLFLHNGLLPKKDLILFSLKPLKANNNNQNQNQNPIIKKLLIKMKKKWKRFERYSFSYLIGDIVRSWKPIVNILSPNISKSFYIENNDYGLLYLSSNNICNNNMYIYNPINCTKDITFITTNVFNDLFAITNDIHLCVLNAKRTSLKTNNTQSKLVFIAIIPSIIDSTASVALSNEIWTDNFDEFEDIMSHFPVQSSINDIKMCVVDINPFIEETELNFESIDIVQVKFINCYRLAVLAKLNKRTCLLSINLKKIQFEFQENKANDYEMSINEMAFDFGIIPVQININNVNKYLFGNDVDAQMLSINGPRKLAAISCDPCIDNKCNRLIVLDINVVDDDDGKEDDDDDEDTENEQESYSYTNEDSDLRKIIDVD